MANITWLETCAPPYPGLPQESWADPTHLHPSTVARLGVKRTYGAAPDFTSRSISFPSSDTRDPNISGHQAAVFTVQPELRASWSVRGKRPVYYSDITPTGAVVIVAGDPLDFASVLSLLFGPTRNLSERRSVRSQIRAVVGLPGVRDGNETAIRLINDLSHSSHIVAFGKHQHHMHKALAGINHGVVPLGRSWNGSQSIAHLARDTATNPAGVDRACRKLLELTAMFREVSP